MDVDLVALVVGLVGVASLVPAIMSSRLGVRAYRPWYGCAFAVILGGLVCTGLGIFVWPAGSVLYWLGVLLVVSGALVVWSLRFRTWKGPRQAVRPTEDRS